MLYVVNGIPQDFPQFKIDEILRLRESFRIKTFVLKGVLRWKSNQAPVPLHTFRDAYCTPPDAQATACEKHSDEVITAYLASRAKMSDEDRMEELLEARAAHGPGVTLVNVLSGQTITT